MVELKYFDAMVKLLQLDAMIKLFSFDATIKLWSPATGRLEHTFTGHQAGKYLRTRNPGMRILVVAGLLADDRLQDRAELEKVAIFPQPFTGEQLLAGGGVR